MHKKEHTYLLAQKVPFRFETSYFREFPYLKLLYGVIYCFALYFCLMMPLQAETVFSSHVHLTPENLRAEILTAELQKEQTAIQALSQKMALEKSATDQFKKLKSDLQQHQSNSQALQKALLGQSARLVLKKGDASSHSRFHSLPQKASLSQGIWWDVYHRFSPNSTGE